MRRGFALFFALAFSTHLLAWMAAVHAVDVQAAQSREAMVLLSRQRLIVADVKGTLGACLTPTDADLQLALAAAVKCLELAEAHLERAYRLQGVELDAFFGFLTDAELGPWLESMAQSGRASICPRCLDLGAVGVGADSVLFHDGSGFVVSSSGTHRASLPFPVFGRPVLGAALTFSGLSAVASVP